MTEVQREKSGGGERGGREQERDGGREWGSRKRGSREEVEGKREEGEEQKERRGREEGGEEHLMPPSPLRVHKYATQHTHRQTHIHINFKNKVFPIN